MLVAEGVGAGVMVSEMVSLSLFEELRLELKLKVVLGVEVIVGGGEIVAVSVNDPEEDLLFVLADTE